MDELLIKGALGAARAFAEHTGMFDTFTDSLLVSDAPSGGVVQAVFKPEEQAGAVIDASCIADPELQTRFIYDDKCRGFIDALTRLGMSEDEATKLAIKTGAYDPDAFHNDPHWRESAAIREGTRFEKYSDGSIKVFDQNGKQIVAIDCDGNVTDRFGDTKTELMIDTEKCELDDYQKEPVAAPAPVEQVIKGPQIQSLEVCASDLCRKLSGLYIFNGVDSVEAYIENPTNASQLLVAFDRANPFVIIKDGEGSLQCLKLEVVGEGEASRLQVKLDENGRPEIYALEMYERVRDLRSGLGSGEFTYKLVGHMQEGEQFQKYVTGYEGTEGPRSAGGREQGIEFGETLFPSAPQQLVLNPETGVYGYEPLETSATRTVNVWLAEAGISASEWNDLYDMPLPEEFADPKASFNTRVEALIKAAAEVNGPEKPGVDLDREGAEELTRIITEAQGKDAGLSFNEKGLKSVEFKDGSGKTITSDGRLSVKDGNKMVSLDTALFDTSRRITGILRLQQTGRLETEF